jgi:hypothetical protein
MLSHFLVISRLILQVILHKYVFTFILFCIWQHDFLLPNSMIQYRSATQVKLYAFTAAGLIK